MADSCDDCTGTHGEDWCNGDCSWSGGKCLDNENSLSAALEILRVVACPSTPTLGSSWQEAPGVLNSNVPEQVSIAFEKRWDPKVLSFPGILGYGSASFALCDQTIFVLNGANIGNYIAKFSLGGEWDGTCPGFYNLPVDLVAGPECQLLISAIGAMNASRDLRFGMETYKENCEFQRGFHESDTGLVRPYGLAQAVPGDNRVLVADWGNNRTVELLVDWQTGSVSTTNFVLPVPYPSRLAVTTNNIVVASAVCCEPWQVEDNAIHFFTRQGALIRRVKDVGYGRTVTDLLAVAADSAGNFLVVDRVLGTFLFSPSGELMQELSGLGAPLKIVNRDDFLYTLTEQEDGTFMNKFSYSYDRTY